jgi:hypothetical protein
MYNPNEILGPIKVKDGLFFGDHHSARVSLTIGCRQFKFSILRLFLDLTLTGYGVFDQQSHYEHSEPMLQGHNQHVEALWNQLRELQLE